MDKERERDFLKVLGSKYTKDILEYIDEHGKGQYTEFREFANAHIECAITPASEIQAHPALYGEKKN